MKHASNPRSLRTAAVSGRPRLAAVLLFGSLGCAGLLATGCDEMQDASRRRNQGVGGPNCTEVGASYTGFDGTKLEEKRVEARIGADRARIKPYSALRGEYERTIGVVPGSLESAAPSFGNPAERFSSEPRASAIQVYTAFRVAFDGCLTYTESSEAFASAPTAASAAAECKAMARRFWSRAPTDAEVAQCAQVATVDSASEGDPRRRWAYTCAALLSSAGFLTY